MSTVSQIIPSMNLALAFIPVVAVLFILYKWSIHAMNVITVTIGRLCFDQYFRGRECMDSGARLSTA